jgi:hypothetical protein
VERGERLAEAERILDLPAAADLAAVDVAEERDSGLAVLGRDLARARVAEGDVGARLGGRVALGGLRIHGVRRRFVLGAHRETSRAACSVFFW